MRLEVGSVIATSFTCILAQLLESENITCPGYDVKRPITAFRAVELGVTEFSPMGLECRSKHMLHPAEEQYH